MDGEFDSPVASPPRRVMSPRKKIIRRLNDDFSGDRERWLKRAAFFHHEDLRYSDRYATTQNESVGA
jgi:hypothetical protein